MGVATIGALLACVTLSACEPNPTDVAALRALGLRIDVRVDRQKTAINSATVANDLLTKLDQAEAAVRGGASLDSAFAPFETDVSDQRGTAIYAPTADKLLGVARGQVTPSINKVTVGAASTVTAMVNGSRVSLGIPAGTSIAAVAISAPVVPRAVTPLGATVSLGGVQIKAWDGAGNPVTQPSGPLSLSVTFTAPPGVHAGKSELNTIDPLTLRTQPLATTVTKSSGTFTASASVSHLSPFEVTAPPGSGIVTNYAGSAGEGEALSVGQYESGMVTRGSALYISDNSAGVVRAVDTTTGRETVLAGTTGGDGVAAAAGDGGPATSALLHDPMGLAVDAAGNVYIADSEDSRIRKVDTQGVITTVAGTGDLLHQGYSGDGGPATAAQLNHPSGVALDGSGNLYIADAGNSVIRKVDPGGVITTTPWNKGTPVSLVVDGAGNLYVGSDSSAAGVYTDWLTKLDPSGTQSVLRSQPGYAGWYLALDTQGGLLIADNVANVVQRYDLASGSLSSFAGTGAAGFAGDTGPATAAELWGPLGLTVDDAGTAYIADSQNRRVRSVDYAGTITTVAGNGTANTGGDGQPAVSAQLQYPLGVAVDAGGNLLITDYSNNAVRKVDPSGTISTLAAGISHPTGIAVGPDGSVFVSSLAEDGPSSVVKVDPTGSVSSLAAGFITPAGLATDAAGDVYVVDQGQVRVFRVNPSGSVTPFAGNGSSGFAGDGGPATSATLAQPYGLARDASGNLYIADYGEQRVRKVDARGIISTVAGNGVAGFGGDGGPATAATLNNPLFVAVDAAGRLYIADSRNSRVRTVGADGVITTVVGSGMYGHNGDGGPATNAKFAFIDGLAFDAGGNLYLADSSNNCVRRVAR